MTDQEFLHAFATAELPPQQFDHKAHLRLAYLMLERHPRDEAGELIGQQIRNYTVQWEASDKYNHTLTLAAVYVMAHFMERKPGLSFEELLHHFPKLLTGFQGLVGQHYSRDLLNSSEAKKNFLQPDKTPFEPA